jgi:hypothetical protein
MPTVRVALKDGQAGWRRRLQAAFEKVPIPPNAKPAAGSDGHMTIYQPSTDRLWEFWQARRDSKGGWHASFGGAIQDVSRSPGYYTKDSWPGARSYWGATATSLPVIGGTMMLTELRRGRIDHALAISIPHPRAKEFSWPAQRSDGAWESPNAIPEGARFRLDPRLDLAKLRLPPLVRTMAEAAQRHGMVVRDRSGGAIGFFAEGPRRGQPNRFFHNGRPRAGGHLQGKWPHQLLARFPWRHLQLMRMRLCTSGPCAPSF